MIHRKHLVKFYGYKDSNANLHYNLGSINCINKFDPVQNILFHLVAKKYYTIFSSEPRVLNIAVQLLSKVTILIVVSYQTHLQSQRAYAQYYVRCMLNAQQGLYQLGPFKHKYCSRNAFGMNQTAEMHFRVIF